MGFKIIKHAIKIKCIKFPALFEYLHQIDFLYKSVSQYIWYFSINFVLRVKNFLVNNFFSYFWSLKLFFLYLFLVICEIIAINVPSAAATATTAAAKCTMKSIDNESKITIFMFLFLLLLLFSDLLRSALRKSVENAISRITS